MIDEFGINIMPIKDLIYFAESSFKNEDIEVKEYGRTLFLIIYTHGGD
jgi:hypothetical protein